MRATFSVLLMTIFLAAAVIGSGKPKQKAPATQATFLPALQAIVQDPKAQKPTTTDVKADKTVTTFTYADAPTLRSVVMTVSKERTNAWRLKFETNEQITADSFGGPAKATLDFPDHWFEILDGPMKGRILHLDGASVELMTDTFILTTSFNFEDRKMMRWACESDRGGVANTITVDSFLKTCREAVTAKLARPDTADFHYLGVAHDVRVSKDCEYQWSSDVTAKNAFNAEIKNPFRCSFSPKTGLVESSVGR